MMIATSKPNKKNLSSDEGQVNGGGSTSSFLTAATPAMAEADEKEVITSKTNDKESSAMEVPQQEEDDDSSCSSASYYTTDDSSLGSIGDFILDASKNAITEEVWADHVDGLRMIMEESDFDLMVADGALSSTDEEEGVDEGDDGSEEEIVFDVEKGIGNGRQEEVVFDDGPGLFDDAMSGESFAIDSFNCDASSVASGSDDNESFGENSFSGWSSDDDDENDVNDHSEFASTGQDSFKVPFLTISASEKNHVLRKRVQKLRQQKVRRGSKSNLLSSGDDSYDEEIFASVTNPLEALSPTPSDIEEPIRGRSSGNKDRDSKNEGDSISPCGVMDWNDQVSSQESLQASLDEADKRIIELPFNFEDSRRQVHQCLSSRTHTDEAPSDLDVRRQNYESSLHKVQHQFSKRQDHYDVHLSASGSADSNEPNVVAYLDGSYRKDQYHLATKLLGMRYRPTSYNTNSNQSNPQEVQQHRLSSYLDGARRKEEYEIHRTTLKHSLSEHYKSFSESDDARKLKPALRRTKSSTSSIPASITDDEKKVPDKTKKVRTKKSKRQEDTPIKTKIHANEGIVKCKKKPVCPRKGSKSKKRAAASKDERASGLLVEKGSHVTPSKAVKRRVVNKTRETSGKKKKRKSSSVVAPLDAGQQDQSSPYIMKKPKKSAKKKRITITAPEIEGTAQGKRNLAVSSRPTNKVSLEHSAKKTNKRRASKPASGSSHHKATDRAKQSKKRQKTTSRTKSKSKVTKNRSKLSDTAGVTPPTRQWNVGSVNSHDLDYPMPQALVDDGAQRTYKSSSSGESKRSSQKVKNGGVLKGMIQRTMLNNSGSSSEDEGRRTGIRGIFKRTLSDSPLSKSLKRKQSDDRSTKRFSRERESVAQRDSSPMRRVFHRARSMSPVRFRASKENKPNHEMKVQGTHEAEGVSTKTELDQDEISLSDFVCGQDRVPVGPASPLQISPNGGLRYMVMKPYSSPSLSSQSLNLSTHSTQAPKDEPFQKVLLRSHSAKSVSKSFNRECSEDNKSHQKVDLSFGLRQMLQKRLSQASLRGSHDEKKSKQSVVVSETIALGKHEDQDLHCDYAEEGTKTRNTSGLLKKASSVRGLIRRTLGNRKDLNSAEGQASSYDSESEIHSKKPRDRAIRPLIKRSAPADQVRDSFDSIGLNPKRMGRDRFFEMLSSDPSKAASFKMLKVGSSHATHTPDPDSDSDSPSDSDDSSLDPSLLRSSKVDYGSSQDLNQSFTKKISSRVLAWRSRKRESSSSTASNVRFFQPISA